MRLLDHARLMRRVSTPAEHELWEALRHRRLGGRKFQRQVPMGHYIVEFYCHEAKLVIEVDGATHSDATTDADRDAWLRSQGLRVARFWNNDVTGNLNGVLTQILTLASPSPSGEGRGEG